MIVVAALDGLEHAVALVLLGPRTPWNGPQAKLPSNPSTPPDVNQSSQHILAFGIFVPHAHQSRAAFPHIRTGMLPASLFSTAQAACKPQASSRPRGRMAVDLACVQTRA